MQNENTPTESSKKVFIVYCETTKKISFENKEILISVGKDNSHLLKVPYLELPFKTDIPENIESENVFVIYSESAEIPRYDGDTIVIPTETDSPKIFKLERRSLLEMTKKKIEELIQ